MKKLIQLVTIAAALSGCQNQIQKVVNQDSKSHPYTYLSGRTFTDKKVMYEVVAGEAIVEGDISLGTVEEAEARRIFKETNRNAVSIPYRSMLWDRGIVPYEINSDVENTERIYWAMDQIHSYTGIQFVKRTNEKDYIYFQPAPKDVCSSPVGKRGGRQGINIGERCSNGSTAHEILHSIGLWHEQSREDRDEYITIQWDNIESDKRFNFEQHIEDGKMLTNYDYLSIMHYHAMSFSKNGKPTILRKDGSPRGMGQREGLSPGDIRAVSALYSL